MSTDDYLELLCLTKETLEGQAILEAITGTEPDQDFISKQNRKMAQYERKIIEMTKG